MSTESRFRPQPICMHHLANKCEYGEKCHKRHADISQLTTAQMLAFTKFQKRAVERDAPVVEEEQQVVAPTPVVQAPVAAVAVVPQPPKEELDDEEMPSCMLYPQGRCSDRNKKCLSKNRHRNLVDFTDEELEKFQRLVTQFAEMVSLKK